MKQVIFICLFSITLAAKLGNTYLPPAHARSSGGSQFLSTPFQIGHVSSGTLQSHAPLSRNEILGQTYQSQYSRYPSKQANQLSGLTSSNGLGQFSSGAGLYSGSPGFGSLQYGHSPDNILKYNNLNNGDGSYQFEFETENKIAQKEVGLLQNPGTDRESSVVQGDYSYVAPDGQTVAVKYIADENGFRVIDDNIPGIHAQYSQNRYGQPGGQNGFKQIGNGPFNKPAEYSQINSYDQQPNAQNRYGTFGNQNNFKLGSSGTYTPGNAAPISGQPHESALIGVNGQNKFQSFGRNGDYDQGFNRPYTGSQISRQYLPPTSSVHTGY